MTTIGVLALQGDFREHLRAIDDLGQSSVPVRRARELTGLDGLIIPGGESTAIDKLARSFDIAQPIKDAIADGLPVYGSCAGLIMLADHIVDPAHDLKGNPQQTFGGIDMSVRRNAFGRQVDSFEEDIDFKGLSEPLKAVFIRAPWVERVGENVEILASVPVPALDATRIVAVRSRNLLATSFHPEVSGERRVHELFIKIIRGEA
ncbi:pyridoxal 5'-phosphate synthase glutaminase subunit PdxT [Neomicrococcus aestuarii]|uniref:Pyridoxal 5'-phosphate synthase subunit PdxT n=1 Tax=Neomicrococcus aestuarii TaxID=556325 RepID=A0A1L2ZKT9_9MICC|nr:pyridoxal 5'-phosphate synthase glutaminase subunit PdxT [Neomicrococcus aestuarii]APF40035.1 glutamine amidotransferase subunit PdxT [Neomicrococcus aestuarii]MBB5512027.1 5'-phosphate synthase pdxT subunit [Neomicrococcus aestuarii]